MNQALVEVFFMMIVLKLPVVYLFGVVWWAVRAEPRPPEESRLAADIDPVPCPWRRARPRPGPRGRLPRGPATRRSRVSA